MAHGEASGKPAGEQAAGDDADGERGPSPDAEYLRALWKRFAASLA